MPPSPPRTGRRPTDSRRVRRPSSLTTSERRPRTRRHGIRNERTPAPKGALLRAASPSAALRIAGSQCQASGRRRGAGGARPVDASLTRERPSVASYAWIAARASRGCEPVAWSAHEARTRAMPAGPGPERCRSTIPRRSPGLRRRSAGQRAHPSSTTSTGRTPSVGRMRAGPHIASASSPVGRPVASPCREHRGHGVPPRATTRAATSDTCGSAPPWSSTTVPRLPGVESVSAHAQPLHP